MLKIQFGCGGNLLKGWNNHDIEVDITNPLPYENGTAIYILAEHVVEHVTTPQAFAFFKECNRILTIGGILRVCVPSVSRVFDLADKEYLEWLGKSGFGKPNLRSAIENQIVNHGHLAAYDYRVLNVMLYAAGFDHMRAYESGQSDHAELRGIEGHAKVIGEHPNLIETLVIEAEKQF